MWKEKNVRSKKTKQILTEKLNDPDKTVRDIARIVDVSPATVSRRLQQLETIQESTIDELLRDNLDIISKWTTKILDYVQQYQIKDDTFISDIEILQKITDKALKQNLLLQGKATDNVAVISEIRIL